MSRSGAHSRRQGIISCFLLAALAACSGSSLGSTDRALSNGPVNLDTAATVLTVDPPLIKNGTQPALCLALDTARYVVELPHQVLRSRTPKDSTYLVMAFERRTDGAIVISGEVESVSGTRGAISPSSYASSHQLCMGLPLDSIARVRLRSNVPLTLREVSFVTSNK